MGTHTAVPTAGHFPAVEVEACIRETLGAVQSDQQVLRPRAASACEPDIDSLVVIEVICAIEELLGVRLPTSFAPRGGYDGLEACVSDLLAETRVAWLALVKQAEEYHV
jgi:acyl carrier protein